MHHHLLTPIEWDAVARDPRFKQLMRGRARFIAPATIFFICYYLALPIAVGFWPKVMSRPVYGPLTLAYVFALSQFAMAWIVLALYMRRARRFDALAAEIVARGHAEFQP